MEMIDTDSYSELNVFGADDTPTPDLTVLSEPVEEKQGCFSFGFKVELYTFSKFWIKYLSIIIQSKFIFRRNLLLDQSRYHLLSTSSCLAKGPKHKKIKVDSPYLKTDICPKRIYIISITSCCNYYIPCPM